MSSFSQRKGLKPTKVKLQLDDMDLDLRNGLWNALTQGYWKLIPYGYISDFPSMRTLMERLWDAYFKQPLDTLNDLWDPTYRALRDHFFNASWHQVYDFIEFVAENFPSKRTNDGFMEFCNLVLQRELSAYRFVAGKILQITSPEEIGQIEKALQISGPLQPVSNHLKRALDLLSDRESPDYRNSIKESISSVEAMCQLIADDRTATLGQGLKQLENKKVMLHGALKSAFSSLYGYTSSAEGIRHALLEEPGLDHEDAMFMLVSCSAFINYLVCKCSKAEIKL